MAFGMMKKGVYEFVYTFENVGAIHFVGIPYNLNDPSFKPNGKITVESMTIEVFVPFYNGRLCEDTLRSTLQHEVEHAYQLLLKKGTPKKDVKHDYNAIYNKALEDCNSNDSHARYIATYFYSCSKYEQDGFVNGLYGSLKGKSIPDDDYLIDMVKNSQVGLAIFNIYHILQRLIDAQKRDKKEYNAYNAVINKYGVSYTWTIRLGNSSIKRLLRKTNHVLKKLHGEQLKSTFSPYLNLAQIID